MSLRPGLEISTELQPMAGRTAPQKEGITKQASDTIFRSFRFPNHVTRPRFGTPAYSCAEQYFACKASDMQVGGEPDLRVLTFRPHQGKVSERRVHRQRPHRKSRTGCLTCKARRVKCDEIKPRCTQCARRLSSCMYASEPVSSTTATLALGTAQSLPHIRYVLTDQPPLPNTENERLAGIPRAALIHHFQRIFPSMTPVSADVAPILTLGIQHHHFLLHAALAISATHLRCHVTRKQECRVAAHFQQSLAIPSFHRALQRSLDQQLADALVLTSVFMNVLSFACVEDAADPAQSWLFSDDPRRLGWFSVNLGLKALIRQTGTFQKGSVLNWMYNAADDERRTFYGKRKPPDHIPEHWKGFLQLNATPTSESLYEPARVLAEVKKLEPTRDSFFLYQNFMGAMDDDLLFRDLLLQRDARAIWLLGYWMGLLCRFDHWWVRARARLEWRASCIWMREQAVAAEPSLKGDVWREVIQDLEGARIWNDGTQE